MEWLDWAVKAATVIGGTFFLVCALVGFYYLLQTYRSTLIFWQARKRWLEQQRLEAQKEANPKKNNDEEQD